MEIADINKIFSILAQDNHNPKTELEYTNHYTLLVAIMLSAQSTDIAVNKATQELFKIVDSPRKMIDLGEDKLKSFVKSIGLYNTKSRNIIKTSEIIVNQYNDLVPDSLNILESLPGIGTKTANVFLNCAYGMPVIGVDTHVSRVSNRLGFCSTKDPKKVTNILTNIIPLKWKKYAHHWLILHGRYICKAKNPQCEICKIKNYCSYYFSSGRNPPI